MQIARSLLPLTPRVAATVAATLLLTSPAWSATYYLSTTGSDSSTKNGSSSQPWSSIGYAMTRMATGDDLTLKEGTYYWGGTQNVTKGGTSSNRMIIQGEAGKTVIINGQYAGNASGIESSSTYVTVQNIQVTNFPNGAGIKLKGSYSRIESCKAYLIGWPGLQIGPDGQNISNWNNAPTGSVINGCSTWDCGKTNDPSWWNYKGLRENNGGWSASISAVNSKNTTISNCWAGGNWGEGIITHKVRGGDTSMSNNYARDNWSVNIYVDNVSGESSNWVAITKNTAETTWDSTKYRSGAPAHNFVIAAENYDGIGLGSNPCAYVSFDENKAYNGGHDFYTADFGKPVHDITYNYNTASGSSWGNYKQDSGSNIYNIWFNGNSGF